MDATDNPPERDADRDTPPELHEPDAAVRDGARQNSVFEAVEVEIEARLGTLSMSVKELLELELGSVLGLDRTIADPVDLRLKGKPVARGEIVTVDDHFAVKITEILEIE